MLAVIVPENVALRLCILLGLFILTYLFAFYLSQYISGLLNKDAKSVYIFGSVPIFYYAINYFLEIKTNFWSISAPMITEFFRFLVCIVFLLFCVVYYKEYEQKADLDLKEQIINISFEQQKKEMELIKEREQEIRISRHDMRLFLNTLIMHIHQDDKDAALKLATTLVSNIEATTIQHYSNNNIVNYIARLSLLIYIFHENLLLRTFYRPQMWNYVYKQFGYEDILIWTLILVVLVFSFGLIASIIYRNTMEKIVTSVCDWLYPNLQKIYKKIESNIMRYH